MVNRNLQQRYKTFSKNNFRREEGTKEVEGLLIFTLGRGEILTLSVGSLLKSGLKLKKVGLRSALLPE